MLKMNKGEKAHVWIHPGKWGFGAAGKPELDIPGNAGLEYIVHLKTFENVSPMKMCALIGFKIVSLTQ